MQSFLVVCSSFGYLNKEGYCTDRQCHKFAVVMDEFGARFADQADVDTLYDLAAYMHNIGSAKDSLHNRIGSWIWWVLVLLLSIQPEVACKCFVARHASKDCTYEQQIVCNKCSLSRRTCCRSALSQNSL